MRFLKLNFSLNVSLSILALAFTVNAFASGGGEAAAGEKKEGEAAAPIPKDQKEFIEKSAKLTTLTNRISESEKTFQELVKKKNTAKSTEEKQDIIRQMVELTNARNKDVDAYNKVKSDLTYRYPTQGEALGRRYQTQNKRSVEELEGVAGLDELLTRTKKVVEKKFAPFKPEEDEKTAKPKVAQPGTPGTHGETAAAPGEEAPKRLRLEK